MRTLEKNKQILWYVEVLGLQSKLDDDGFETGEFVKIYSSPKRININIYPSNGIVLEQMFGKDKSYDMVAVSNDIILNENSLLFINEPLVNYDLTYNYRVETILKSLNSYAYGLRSRT